MIRQRTNERGIIEAQPLKPTSLSRSRRQEGKGDGKIRSVEHGGDVRSARRDFGLAEMTGEDRWVEEVAMASVGDA